jgi:exopolyphosphatase/guanosine-5'-triphosphate,3'-diphosphate pyrophosphatase
MDRRRYKPIAIVDIGSNSVRLVAYEGLTRALTPVFNEKVLCGLGKGVATTGLLAQDGIDKAVAALRNFRALCRNMDIAEIHVLATAATRDATNGAGFLNAARDAIGTEVVLIGGTREAELSALGVMSSFHRADGIVGDLGGGSLELIEVKKTKTGKGVSLPIGGLALADLSKGSPKRAIKIVRDAFKSAMPLKALNGRPFYAVGGTWRALAKLHMSQRNYPLNVMHGYVIPADEAGAFASLVERVNTEALTAIAAVASARRPLLSYGAVVLDELIRQGRPKEIVISAFGVREGLLFERLSAKERASDPLISAARHLNLLRSRSPGHGEDLCQWTDIFMKTTHLEEAEEDKRLRHSACLLADISWRAHPDYRSSQALNMIANAAFVGVDHPGRGYLALAVTYRHMGADEDVSPQLRGLVSARLLDRARILAAAMRVAYILSAGMADVLPRTSLRCVKTKLVLTLSQADSDLASEKVTSRLRQLGRLIGREPEVRIVG